MSDSNEAMLSRDDPAFGKDGRLKSCADIVMFLQENASQWLKIDRISNRVSTSKANARTRLNLLYAAHIVEQKSESHSKVLSYRLAQDWDKWIGYARPDSEGMELDASHTGKFLSYTSDSRQELYPYSSRAEVITFLCRAKTTSITPSEYDVIMEGVEDDQVLEFLGSKVVWNYRVCQSRRTVEIW